MMSLLKCVPLLVILVISAVRTAWGGEIRFNFLNNTNALEETSMLLLKNGCRNDSVAGFKTAVAACYNSSTQTFDNSRLPAEQMGYYCFKNVKDAQGARSQIMGWSLFGWGSQNYRSSVNCSGTAALIMNGMGLNADNAFSNLHKEGIANRSVMAGVKVIYPNAHNELDVFSDDMDRVSRLTGVRIGTNDYQAIVSLMHSRHFPASLSKVTGTKELFAAQVEQWRADGLRWHPAIGILLEHSYKSALPGEKRILLEKEHMALYFREEGRVILLGKTSHAGPFLRCDFNTEDELAEFLMSGLVKHNDMLNPKDPRPRHFLISINDRLIRSYDPPEKQVQEKDGSNTASGYRLANPRTWKEKETPNN